MSTSTRRARTNAAPTSRDWQARGACRQEDPELFFPIGSSPLAKAQEDTAKRVCWRCPVMEMCGQYALESRQDTGVWGGMSEDDRRRLHRRKGRRTYRPGQMRASEHVLTYQLPEFLALKAKGLRPIDIARGLRTNVQTVNSVTRKLDQRAVKEVKAA